MAQPDITVYFLNASRAIRIVWLLEELSLPYKLVAYDRAATGFAPEEFKEKVPTHLKKSPTITDGDLVIQESGAIVDYILDTYDSEGKLKSKTDPRVRVKTQEWVHAAEGTFMLHGASVLFARMTTPEASKASLPEVDDTLLKFVRSDLDWIEGHLREQGAKFLVGDKVSAADIMMQFSIEFLYVLNLGLTPEEAGKKGGDGRWPETKRWLERCMNEESFKRAVSKSGYTLTTLAPLT